MSETQAQVRSSQVTDRKTDGKRQTMQQTLSYTHTHIYVYIHTYTTHQVDFRPGSIEALELPGNRVEGLVHLTTNRHADALHHDLTKAKNTRVSAFDFGSSKSSRLQSFFSHFFSQLHLLLPASERNPSLELVNGRRVIFEHNIRPIYISDPKCAKPPFSVIIKEGKNSTERDKKPSCDKERKKTVKNLRWELI